MKKLKILYGIQCTGNGHISRSKEIIKYLQDNYTDKIETIDICLSGNFSQIDTSDLNVKYKFEGLGFNMNNGQISIWKTLVDLKLVDFFKSIFVPQIKDYDIIISDFEPVTCWSGILRGKKVIGVGNHYKFLSNKKFLKNLSPTYFYNKFITKLVSPVNKYIAFEYLKDNENDFFPIIRKVLRRGTYTSEDFYICYLSSISSEDQVKFFNLFPNQVFYIFHNDIKEASDFENIRLRSIDRVQFTNKLMRCKGVICHTGFQLTSECLFLGKKLLVIPIKHQIEQIYNTKTLSKFGVISCDNLEVPIFDDFFLNDYSVKLNYIDEMKSISEKILSHRS
jgi:uncharacterized protein (TIGR00661 family)